LLFFVVDATTNQVDACRKDEEKETRCQIVLTAAAELFAKKGFEGVSTKNLSVRAKQIAPGMPGLAEPALYSLFCGPLEARPNKLKRAIIAELFKRYWSQFNTWIEQVLNRIDLAKDPTEIKSQLAELYRGMVEHIDKTGHAGVVFVMESRNQQVENVVGGLREFANRLDNLILRARNKGFFRDDLNIQAIRQQFIGCGENTLLGWFWPKRGDTYPCDYTLEEGVKVFEAVLDGLSTKTKVV
jgi:AcrR family transcriptional regulator